jgi:hypothetical protein
MTKFNNIKKIASLQSYIYRLRNYFGTLNPITATIKVQIDVAIINVSKSLRCCAEIIIAIPIHITEIIKAVYGYFI